MSTFGIVQFFDSLIVSVKRDLILHSSVAEVEHT